MLFHFLVFFVFVVYDGVIICCVHFFQCFAVRSLGWVEMAEEDLAPGKSSVAVNNCIRQLSYCKNDIRDTVGIWGEVMKTLLFKIKSIVFAAIRRRGGGMLRKMNRKKSVKERKEQHQLAWINAS